LTLFPVYAMIQEKSIKFATSGVYQ
jgi:hypothetical protein